jgi:hypothetical protein
LVASQWPVLAISRAHETPVEDFCGETAVLVVRPDAELKLVACPPGPAAFLGACLAGNNFHAAADTAIQADENFDFGRALVELTRIGAIVDFV